MEPQSELSGLIPKGLGFYWMLFLIGLFSIAGLEYAYFQRIAIGNTLRLESIPFLDVESPEGILCWGLSTVLALTAGIAWINYRLGRKHKDPASRTTGWFWSAVCLLALSLDVQVAIRDTVRQFLTGVTGTALYGDGTIWWLGGYAFIFFLLGSRLVVDLSHYAPSFGLFLLAVAGIVAGILIDLGLLPLPLGETEIVITRTSAKSISALFLLLSFLLFARRQVFRDPEIAMRWFSKVWNQTMSPTPKPEQKPTAKEQQSTAPKQPLAEMPTAAEATGSSTSFSPALKSGIILPSQERPLVQKAADVKKIDVVRFRANGDHVAEDDGFDLADSA